MFSTCCASTGGSVEAVDYSGVTGAPTVINQFGYSLELECSEKDTRHWRHAWCYKNNKGKTTSKPALLSEDEPNIITSLLGKSVKERPNEPCVGTRTIQKEVREDKKIFWYKGDYSWTTYGQMGEIVDAAARGMLGLDHVTALQNAGKCTAGILAETSMEWMVSAQAAFKAGISITTVYTTLGHEAMLFGLNETECPLLVVDWCQFHALDGPVLSKCPSLKHVVLIGKCWVPEEVIGGTKEPFPSSQEVAAMAKKCKAKVITLDALIDSGKSRSGAIAQNPKEEDLAVIMYTSGSTGQPKGVMLSHQNFMGTCAGVWAQDVCVGRPDDKYIGYLPLAHIFEMLSEVGFLGCGCKIGYGSPKTLSAASVYMPKDSPSGADLMQLKPTIMCAVPAILDLIKSGITRILQGMEGFKGDLVRAAVARAMGGEGEDPVASILCSLGAGGPVLKKVRSQLGLENLRWIASGGAPLSAETQCFIAAVLAPVAQGFGCTETTGVASIQEVFSSDGRVADTSSGCVGNITPSSEIKLKSVPDMGYLVTDSPPRGEILLGGFGVSQMGYYKKKDKTDEDLPYHGDGRRWFHTGDIGVMTESGALKIIDRKKDLIKLASGEFVALGKVEAALKQVPGIGACVVFAKPEKDHCVAIVSQPEKGWPSVGGRPEEARLVKMIEVTLLKQGLVRFEIPTKVKVDDMIWTPETGLITASLKVQRNPLRTHYNGVGGLLDQMEYAFNTK